MEIAEQTLICFIYNLTKNKKKKNNERKELNGTNSCLNVTATAVNQMVSLWLNTQIQILQWIFYDLQRKCCLRCSG